MTVPLHVLVVGSDLDDFVFAAADQLDAGIDFITVHKIVGVDTVGSQLAARCPHFAEDDGVANCAIAAMVISPSCGPVDEVVSALHRHPALRRAGVVLITDRKVHDDAAQSISSGALVSVIAVPWTPPALVEQVQAVISRWLQRWLPDEELTHLLGDDLTGQPRGGDLLYGLDSPGEQVQRVLLEGIEKHLGPRPRLIVPAGVDLTRQNESVDAVYLVLRGSVALHRSSHFGDVLLHHATSGPLIGLISLARQQRALFTSTTTTEVELVRLSLEQLEFVLTQSPDTSANLAVVAIQALTQRLVRAEYLHVEKDELAEQLERERARLAQALEELQVTREQLVQQTKYAMLGELSAGIAHELNNPVAALERATDQIAQDLEAVLDASMELRDAREALERARQAPVRSTAEERQLVRQVRQWTGDLQTAKQFVSAEVTDEVTVKSILKKERSFFRRHRRRPGSPLEVLVSAAHIGRAVRNCAVAARRITDLVSSLRAYARPDSAPSADVDIHENIEDTLRLTAHRLRSVRIIREYGQLPPIRAYPARLEQVWTNLLVNACEAFDDEAGALAADGQQLPARGQAAATIVIHTEPVEPSSVRVRITDNGPGIPASLQHKIMEPHFTTKDGQVRFGLGMGMSITSSIVEDHGGHLEVMSRPGQTTMQVTLPISGPPIAAVSETEYEEES